MFLTALLSKVVEYRMQYNAVAICSCSLFNIVFGLRTTDVLNLICLCPKPKDCTKFTIHNTHFWFFFATCEQSYCNKTSAQQDYKRHDIVAPICTSCHIIVLCTHRVGSDNSCSTLDNTSVLRHSSFHQPVALASQTF